MNILMALSQLEVTGAEVYAVTIADELIARGHQVFIVSDTLTKPCKASFIPLAFNKRSLGNRIHHVKTLLNIIKEHDIQVVHAHSRASSWSCALACALARIPLITSTHGRQPVHFSRKFIKAFGCHSICVCENIRTQIVRDLGMDEAKTSLWRNPIDTNTFTYTPAPFLNSMSHPAPDRDALANAAETAGAPANVDTAAATASAEASEAPANVEAATHTEAATATRSEATAATSTEAATASKAAPIKVTLVGRLSGPKGDVAYQVLEQIKDHPDIQLNIVGSKNLPQRFHKFTEYSHIHFVGYVNNVHEYVRASDVIIGAGRAAVEGIVSGRPTIAIGEAIYEGLVTKDSLATALSSNFGDINYVNATSFSYERLVPEIRQALTLSEAELKLLAQQVAHEFSLERIVSAIEQRYVREYVLKKHYEIPVIMYHRVASSAAEHGIHGTYIDKDKFAQHLSYLKSHGYQTLTFNDLKDGKYKERFNKGNKWVILTFDDGYVDNYTTAFPLLKQYGFKAVIFLLSESTYNAWDADDPQRPEKRFALMDLEQIKEMQDYGIEFGAHTKTHPHLAHIPLAEAKAQILECQHTLEQRLGAKLTTFAYPYGDYNDEVKQIVKEAGFKFAVATNSGDITFDCDLFAIRRIGIFPKNSLHTFKRKVSGRYGFIQMRREKQKP